MEVGLSTAAACEAIPLLEVKGEVDHSNLFDLTIAVGSLLRERAPVILLDVSAVTYIDSGGLSVFYNALRQMDDSGWLGIINPRPHVLRMLELIGLTNQSGFRVFATLEEAEKAVRECPIARKRLV